MKKRITRTQISEKDQKQPRKCLTDRGIKEGYRSGLEEKIAEQIKCLGFPCYYETFKIPYAIPETAHKYCPDWILPNGIIIESKGRFTTADRKKHLLVQEQHPNLDLRFVFSNSKTKLSKGSKTSYATWCEQHGFKYADRLIPEEWFYEEVKKVEIPEKTREKRSKKNE